jgi:hypothetical protein
MDLWTDLASFTAIPKRSLLNFRLMNYHPGAGEALDRSTQLALAEQIRGGGFKRALTATGMDQGNRLSYQMAMPDKRALVFACVPRSKGQPASTNLTIDGAPVGSVVRTQTEYAFVQPGGAQVGAARFDGLTLNDEAGTAFGAWRAYRKDTSLGEIADDLIDELVFHREALGSSDVLSFGAARSDVILDGAVAPELSAFLVALPVAICFGYR